MMLQLVHGAIRVAGMLRLEATRQEEAVAEDQSGDLRM